MKTRLLLIFSVVCLVAALTILVAIPVVASTLPHGATIAKSSVYNGDGTITSTITVTDADQNVGDILTITAITDTIYHTSGVEVSPNLVSSPFPTLAAIGDTYSATYTFSLRADDPSPISDYAFAEGTDSGLNPPINVFMLYYPDQTIWPLPELSAGALFGLGLCGLGGFVIIKRRKSSVKI